MPKPTTFEDTEIRLKEVISAMKETRDKRLYERYQCIYLLLSGESRKDIAKIINRGLDTICSYVKTYSAFRLKGLEMKHSPGRPTQLTAEQEQELYKTIVEKSPADVGFPATMNWTSNLVRNWIKQQFQVQYSERGARELLYRLGFSYTRPTYKLAKAEPVKQEAFKQEFEGLKKIAGIRN